MNDLLGDQIEQLSRIFKSNYYNFSLYVLDDNELQKRVLDDSRDSGYRDYKAAIEWNKKLINRDLYKNEIKVDNSSNKPEEVVRLILNHIE